MKPRGGTAAMVVCVRTGLTVSALLLGCGPRVEDVAQSTEDDPETNASVELFDEIPV